MCTLSCTDQRKILDIVLQLLFSFSLETGSHWTWNLFLGVGPGGRLADQKTPLIILFPQPPTSAAGVVSTTTLAVLCGCYARMVKRSYTASSPQPPPHHFLMYVFYFIVWKCCNLCNLPRHVSLLRHVSISLRLFECTYL